MPSKTFKSAFKMNKPCYEIKNKTSNQPTEIYIYDEIGFFGVKAETFVKDLKSIRGDVLVRINSPGGSVFDGMAIAQAIRERKDTTNTVVDGLAASAASYIALAGNSVRMVEGAFLMIHDPWSLAIGTSADMRKEADLLDKVRDQIAGFYARKSGKDMSEIQQIMADETWFTGSEALEYGLVDKVDGEQPAENYFDLTVFNNVPDKLQQGPEGGTPSIRDLESALRDAGLNRQQAKAVLSEGKSALETESPEEAWAMIEQLKLTMRG